MTRAEEKTDEILSQIAAHGEAGNEHTRAQCLRIVNVETVLWQHPIPALGDPPRSPRELGIDLGCYVRAICDSLDCDGDGVIEVNGVEVVAS